MNPVFVLPTPLVTPLRLGLDLTPRNRDQMLFHRRPLSTSTTEMCSSVQDGRAGGHHAHKPVADITSGYETLPAY
jgi:hypothetical protein